MLQDQSLYPPLYPGHYRYSESKRQVAMRDMRLICIYSRQHALPIICRQAVPLLAKRDGLYSSAGGSQGGLFITKTN